MQTMTRNATLEDLASMLREQHTRKIDVVAPSSQIRSEGGVIHVDGAEQEITMDGVTSIAGRYRPTSVFDEGVASKLDIPVGYLKRLRAERPDLYDANVNGWLQGNGSPDPRSFLIRAFQGEQGSEGIARAFLSDRYGILDHLDALMATLDGVRQSMSNVIIDSCDLTDRRMYVRVVAPEIRALAPTLLENYRSPFQGGWTVERARSVAAREGMGYEPGTEPVVFAGFEISNSETGGGAFTITPRLVIQICANGLKINADALRAVHLGGRMDDGVIRWSEDTQAKQIELITAKTRDAVATFLDTDYMERTIRGLEEKAGKPIDGPLDKAVKAISKKLTFSEEVSDGILDHFLRGGQFTAAGVMNAVTSYAQVVEDADLAASLEDSAIRSLEVAASLA
jgi:hypothetical protein